MPFSPSRMQSGIPPCCIRSCCFLNRLKASEGRAEHTSAGKNLQSQHLLCGKGSHPHHTMAEVFLSCSQMETLRLREVGSIRGHSEAGSAAWFLSSCLPLEDTLPWPGPAFCEWPWGAGSQIEPFLRDPPRSGVTSGLAGPVP